MGALPVRSLRSEIARAPQTCQASANRSSSARAAPTRSRGKALPVMSSRYGVASSGHAATARPRV
eukprot:12005902-Alexandrium_andersonii.AAC.1